MDMGRLCCGLSSSQSDGGWRRPGTPLGFTLRCTRCCLRSGCEPARIPRGSCTCTSKESLNCFFGCLFLSLSWPMVALMLEAGKKERRSRARWPRHAKHAASKVGVEAPAPWRRVRVNEKAFWSFDVSRRNRMLFPFFRISTICVCTPGPNPTNPPTHPSHTPTRAAGLGSHAPPSLSVGFQCPPRKHTC